MKSKGQEIHERLLAMRLNATTEQELKAAELAQHEAQLAMDEQTREEYHAAIMAEAETDFAKLDSIIQEAEEERMRERLGEVTNIVSLSYIAKNYFGKSRAWLYQRINGNKVNGKVVKFTDTEAQQLQNALHDLGHKLSSIAIV